MPKNTDHGITACVVGLCIMGTLSITSAAQGVSIGNTTALLATLIRQLAYVAIGYAAMNICCRNFKYEYLIEGRKQLALSMGALLLAPLLFAATGGTHAWIRLPFIGATIQPSEFCKTFFILYIASTFYVLKREELPWNRVLNLVIVYLTAYVLIIWRIEDDFGSAFVLGLISCCCVLALRYKPLRDFQNLVRLGLLFLIAVLLFAMSPIFINLIKNSSNYQLQRFVAAANPFYDRYGSGYQLFTGLMAFRRGGLFGTGFGNSLMKYSNFPAATTDYILAVLVEEFGFVFGFIPVAFMYIYIITSLYKYAFKVKNNGDRVILVGTASYAAIHFILNVGGVTGIIPLTGVPLLLLSSGGSSTLSFMMAIGFAQFVIRRYKQGRA